MKKTITGTGSLVLLLSGSLVFAQMGGSMMEGQNKGMHHEQMMEHGQMMGGMMGMSNQMYAMMGNMPPEKTKRMSGVMKDMSHQMLEMSTAMDSGKVSAEEMKKMQDRMMEIQKEMAGMEMHK